MRFDVTASVAGGFIQTCLLACSWALPRSAAAAPSPVLSIAEASNGSVMQGATAVWKIRVSNIAVEAAAATDGSPVTVREMLPPGFTLAYGAGGGGQIAWTCLGEGKRAVVCSNTAVVPGAGGEFPLLTLTVNVPVGSPASVANAVSASGGGAANEPSVSATVGVEPIPSVVKPTFFQRQELTTDVIVPSSGTAFGEPITISGDGSTVLIAGPGSGHYFGAVYVFARMGEAWSLEHMLGDGRQLDDFFGESLALSNDGKTAMVGSFLGPTGTFYQGKISVFHRTGNTWRHTQTLSTSGDAPGAIFGTSAAISGDGTTALIGATQSESTGPQMAYVFTLAAARWTLAQALTLGTSPDDQGYGTPVALSQDGDTLAVAVPSSNDDRGAVHIFARDPAGWSEVATLAAADGKAHDSFGASVALSGDGKLLLVGAPGDFSVVQPGAVYVFARSDGAGWREVQKLIATGETPGDRLGASIAVSGDGMTGVLGSDGAAGKRAGVFVFRNTRDGWVQDQSLHSSDPVLGFGRPVALSNDGRTVLATGDPVIGTSVYAFELELPLAVTP